MHWCRLKYALYLGIMVSHHSTTDRRLYPTHLWRLEYALYLGIMVSHHSTAVSRLYPTHWCRLECAFQSTLISWYHATVDWNEFFGILSKISWYHTVPHALMMQIGMCQTDVPPPGVFYDVQCTSPMMLMTIITMTVLIIITLMMMIHDLHRWC